MMMMMMVLIIWLWWWWEICFTISHYISFLFRFAQTWTVKGNSLKCIVHVIITVCEHHSVWSSQYVIIKACGSNPFIWNYLVSVLQPHILVISYDIARIWSLYPESKQLRSLHKRMWSYKKCDHILWSYTDVNKIIGSCRHEKTWQFLSCWLVNGFWNEVIITRLSFLLFLLDIALFSFCLVLAIFCKICIFKQSSIQIYIFENVYQNNIFFYKS